MTVRDLSLVHYGKADCRGRWGKAHARAGEEEEAKEARGLMTPRPGVKVSSEKPPEFSPVGLSWLSARRPVFSTIG